MAGKWFGRVPRYESARDFRNGAVPGVHRRRRWRLFRHVRTHAERREHCGLEADLGDLDDFPVRIKIRPKRKNIPTQWDDICKSRRGENWKAYRKTRYKSVPAVSPCSRRAKSRDARRIIAAAPETLEIGADPAPILQQSRIHKNRPRREDAAALKPFLLFDLVRSEHVSRFR